MQKKLTFTAATLWLGTMCLALHAQAAPKIQFEELIHDFGQTSSVASVSGIFKFKNTGDAPLKLEPPQPSCGCTTATLKRDTLSPGETGEVAFSMNLGLYRAALQKQIAIRSNDPLSPLVSLTLKVDYIPLYDLDPITLNPELLLGGKAAEQFTTLTRTDGKPLRISKLVASKPWISASVEPGATTNEASARIHVTVQREGSPRRFSEFVNVYASDDTNTPVTGIYLSGLVLGEVLLSPEALYWSVAAGETAGQPAAGERSESKALRRLSVRAADGKTLELKNPQSSIKGLEVKLLPQQAGKMYELLATLVETPATTVSGSISFETSRTAEPRIEVPVIVNIHKP